eukprot:6185272-Pleurochrysis_carterae.AAC.2
MLPSVSLESALEDQLPPTRPASFEDGGTAALSPSPAPGPSPTPSLVRTTTTAGSCTPFACV